MTVVNPKSISGINSITTGSGSDNLLTIHTSDASSTERVRINSSGDVIVGSGITVSPDGDIFATGVTTSTTFVGALTGNVTGTIQTAAQSNITSVGTLTGLTVGGDISVTGDIKNGTSLIDITQNNRIEVDIAGTEIVDINGNGVDVVGGVDISGALKLADTIEHSGDSNTKIRFPDADTVSVETAGSERLRIDSGGRVMIGNTNASTMYQDGGDDLVVGNTSGSHGITIISQNNNVGRLMFSDTYTSGTGTYEGQILYSHASNSLNFYSNYTNNTNLAMSLGGSNGDLTVHGGNVIIGTSGKGIDFSATGDSGGMTSELLDDYEEGTFTPSFAYGLVGSAYESNGQKGAYTKIGRFVYGTILLHLQTASTQDGNVIDIHGLPFTALNHTNGQGGGLNNFYQDGFFNSNDFSGIVKSANNQVRLYIKATGAYLTGSSVNAGREIRCQFWYHAA